MTNYEILGLKRGATLKEIKAKFRELAMKTHPDKGGNAETFIRINTAYEALLNGDSGEADYGLGGEKQRAYQQSQQGNFRAQQQKGGQYRFEGIKKDKDGYLVSFFVEGVDYIEVYGKDFNNIGYYTVRGREGIVNLSIKWDDAKKGKYVFECWLHDGRGSMAKVTYKVAPPKKPSIFDKIKKTIKKLF